MNIKKKKLFATLALVLGLTTMSGCMANAASRPINNTSNTVKSETKNSETTKETKKPDGQISAQWAEIKKTYTKEVEETLNEFELESHKPKGMETWKIVRDVTDELLPASKWKHVNNAFFLGNYKTEFDSNIEAGDIVIAKENAEILSHYAKDVTPKKDIYAYLVYVNKDNKLVCVKFSIVPHRNKEVFSEGGNCRVMLNTGYLKSKLKKNTDGLAFVTTGIGYYTGE